MSAISTLREMAALDFDAEFRAIMNYAEHPTPLDASESAQAFERVVTSRRSIRVFDQAVQVPADVINRALDLALLAPNSSNLQPWEFHWVRSPQAKAELVRLCMSQPPARTASDLIVCVARTRTWKRNCEAIVSKLQADPAAPRGALTYYRLACPMIYTQAANVFSAIKHVLFNLQGLRKPTPREPNFESGMRTWATKSVCLAASIFMLAIRAYGYDSCPMEGCDQHRIKRLLGLPRDARVCMVIAVGQRTARGVYGERLRLDRAWFVKEV
jgi:nitroreductase